MTEAMRERAITRAAACGLDNVEVRPGDASRLRVVDQSADIVICRRVESLALYWTHSSLTYSRPPD